MREWIKVAIVIAIGITLVNDAGRYLIGVFQLDERSRSVASRAAAAAASAPGTPNSGWPTASKLAQEAGIEVFGFQQQGSTVTIWTRLQVTSTWVLGPVNALMRRQPLQTPMTLEQKTAERG